jgi:hypothetical protein
MSWNDFFDAFVVNKLIEAMHTVNKIQNVKLEV